MRRRSEFQIDLLCGSSSGATSKQVPGRDFSMDGHEDDPEAAALVIVGWLVAAGLSRKLIGLLLLFDF